MRDNRGLRSIIRTLAFTGLVLFSCTAAFTGWFISRSLRADDISQSPLNPIGLAVFMIIFVIAAAGVVWALWLIFRENRWAREDSAAEKPKNE